jgi:hypothetical protein
MKKILIASILYISLFIGCKNSTGPAGEQLIFSKDYDSLLYNHENTLGTISLTDVDKFRISFDWVGKNIIYYEASFSVPAINLYFFTIDSSGSGSVNQIMTTPSGCRGNYTYLHFFTSNLPSSYMVIKNLKIFQE